MTRNKNNQQFSITVPTRLVHVPLAASADAVGEILFALNHGSLNAFLFESDDDQQVDLVESGAIAVIPVNGGLTYKGYGWYWRTSYMQIRKNFNTAMEDPAVKAVLFDMHTPGGEIAGVFDLTDDIYKAQGTKPIYAMANENALSGGYLIGSAADKFFLSRTANVGSIGVIAVHEDWSKWNEDHGVTYTAVYAGEKKNDLSPDEPLSDRARKDLQARVDQAYELFVQTVARNRKLDPKVVYDTQAGIYLGEEAVEIGLADKVLSYEGVIEEIAKKISKPKTTAKGVFNMETHDIKGFCEQLKELVTAKNADVMAQLKELGIGPADGMIPKAEADQIKEDARAEGEQSAMERVNGIFDLCSLAGSIGMARNLINEGLTVEQAREKILQAKAHQSTDQTVTSTVGATTTGEVNPLLADARKRAGK